MALTKMQRFWTSPVGDIVRRLPQLMGNLLERYGLQRRIQPGEYFIDGRTNHPALIVKRELNAASKVGPWDYDIIGVSLIDGTEVHGNSAKHSGLAPLTYEQALSHLIVAFWDKGTGPTVWQEASKHVGNMLTQNTLYQEYAKNPR